MNLQHLFEAQKELDERIIKEKGLEGQDLLANKILALQVELGELANEWRGFKFWSNHQQPRTEEVKYISLAENFDQSMVEEIIYNPLLEEYVDCLHFILSLGLSLKIEEEWSVDEIVGYYSLSSEDITEQFIAFNEYLTRQMDAHDWFDIAGLFIGLGEMLGLTWDHIEIAYFSKNKVNHERQSSGY